MFAPHSALDLGQLIGVMERAITEIIIRVTDQILAAVTLSPGRRGIQNTLPSLLSTADWARQESEHRTFRHFTFSIRPLYLTGGR